MPGHDWRPPPPATTTESSSACRRAAPLRVVGFGCGFAPGLTVDLGLLPIGLPAEGLQRGRGPVQPGPGPLERITTTRDHVVAHVDASFLAGPEVAATFDDPLLANVEAPLPLVRARLTRIRDPLAFVGHPLAFVGDLLALIGVMITVGRAGVVDVDAISPRLVTSGQTGIRVAHTANGTPSRSGSES